MNAKLALRWATGLVLVAGLLGACGGAAEKPADGTVSCDVPKLFEKSCAGDVCHSGKDPEDLDLVSAGLDDRLIGIKGSDQCGNLLLVDAGNPDGSFLYQKLSMPKPPCGRHMPQGQDPLSAAELKCVRDYILDARGGPSCETCGTLLCVDLQSDDQHCGTCDNACGQGMQCAAGVCINPCTASQTLCGSSCSDVKTDDLNCGRCGHRCGPGTTCTAGACACDADVPVATFKAQIQPIFKASCGGAECHSGTNKVTKLDLDATVAYEQLVNMAADGDGCTGLRVVPSKPDESYLVDKLLGGELCYGKRMPRSDAALADEAIQRVVGWICAGAKND